MRIVELNEGSMKNLLEEMLKRDPNNYESYTETVQNIVDQVKERGDEAVFAFTKEFDKADVTAENVRVSEAEIEEAYSQVDKDLLAVMRRSMENIRAYHEKQKRNSWFDARPDGTILGMRILPLAVAGVYVPGGKAAYPSSVLMNVIPAKVAGVPKIIMTTPPGRDGRVNPGTLAAAKVAGVDEIYRVGGAQAVAAMAFGTESIPRVDKITGLGLGADDYVTKPFAPMELMARVNSQLRRYRKFLEKLEVKGNVHVIGGLEINEDTVEVSVDGSPVKLTPLEYKILLLLAKNPGRVFSADEIYERVWQERAINTDTVMVHVRNIREKIELDPKNPKYLKVVWGVGYKIEKQD